MSIIRLGFSMRTGFIKIYENVFITDIIFFKENNILSLKVSFREMRLSLQISIKFQKVILWF